MAIKEHKIFVATSEALKWKHALFSVVWRYLYRKSYDTP